MNDKLISKGTGDLEDAMDTTAKAHEKNELAIWGDVGLSKGRWTGSPFAGLYL